MHSYRLLLALLLVAATQTRRVDHEQVASGFACCPDSYIFDENTLSCVCPKTASFVDANGKCVSCNSPSYWNEDQLACLSCPASTVYDKVKK